MAIGGVAASGATASTWKVAPQVEPLDHLSPPSESLSGSGNPINISSKVLGLGVEVHCASSVVSGSIASGGKGTVEISPNGCVDLTQPKCVISFSALSANSELINVGGKTYVKLVPSTGSSFGLLSLEGSECPLNGVKTELKGSLAGSGVDGEAQATQTVTFSEAIDAAAGTQLKFSKEPAALSTSVFEHLSGSRNSFPWRGSWSGGSGEWLVTVGFGSRETAAVSGGPMTLSFGILGSHFSFGCSSVTAHEAVLLSGGTEEISGLTLHECKTSPPTCELESAQQLETLTGSLLEVGGNTYEKFTAKGGANNTMTTLQFFGSSCTLAGLSVEVKGSFAGLGPNLRSLHETQSLEFTSASNTAAEAQLKLGKEAGSITGSMSQRLNGGLSGRAWGVE